MADVPVIGQIGEPAMADVVGGDAKSISRSVHGVPGRVSVGVSARSTSEPGPP
jgi:hypothetical protein